MSEETGSSTSAREVFIPLLNEGTRVLRPARAIACGGRRYRLLKPDDYDPDDEQWEFPPGSEIECRVEVFAGREVLVAQACQD